ncbi:unnamed protein product [Boreogadus saida]
MLCEKSSKLKEGARGLAPLRCQINHLGELRRQEVVQTSRAPDVLDFDDPEKDKLAKAKRDSETRSQASVPQIKTEWRGRGRGIALGGEERGQWNGAPWRSHVRKFVSPIAQRPDSQSRALGLSASRIAYA